MSYSISNNLNNIDSQSLEAVGSTVSLQITKQLVTRGTGVHSVNSNGNTILERLAAHGFPHIIKLLYPNDKALHSQAFFKAVEKGDLSMVTECLDVLGIDVESRNSHGVTALYTAIERGNTALVDLLIYRGANLHCVDRHRENSPASRRWDNTLESFLILADSMPLGESALHLAARCGQKDVVELLLNQGVNAQAEDKNGTTALHLAARFGYTGIVELLLNREVNVDAEDKLGTTALGSALILDHEQIVFLLLAKGAKIDVSFLNPAQKKLYEKVLPRLRKEAEKSLKPFSALPRDLIPIVLDYATFLLPPKNLKA